MKLRYANNGRTIKSAGRDALDFSLVATPLPQIVSPGSSSSSTVLDESVTTSTGTTYYNNYGISRVIAADSLRISERSSPVSLSPGIGSLSNNLVTRVTDGTTVVRVKTPLGTRGVVCNMTQQVGQTLVTREWADGTLAKAITDSIQTRIDGTTPSIVMPLYSQADHNAPLFARNASSWLWDVDLTAISPSNVASGPYRAGVAVTPKHVLYARHYPLAAGDIIRFVTADDQLVSRTVIATASLAGDFFQNDIGVASLASDLPATITPVKVPPANLESYLPNIGPGLVAFGTNAIGERASVRGWLRVSDDSVVFASYTTDQQYHPFYENYISGDSGSPVFMLVNTEPVLLGCITSGGNGQATAVWRKLTELNALIDGLDSGYSLTQVNLTGYPSY